MRWSENTTLDFVKIYLKHELLWNNNHPDYKMRHRRIDAYRDISSEFKSCTNLSLTVPEVKMKIKNLRSTYMQEVYKVLKKSSPDCMYKPSLVWFEDMDRCLKNTAVRRYTSSLPEAQEVDSSCQIWVNQIETSLKEEIDPDPLIPQSDENCDSPKPANYNEIKDESESSTPCKKLKKKKFKHSKSYNSESHVTTEKEDEFDIFGKYIASQLRSMHLQKALRLQLEIHGLVNEARVSEINDDC
ncbi:unnamed protein product [Colias eurytheme]|nr:unnamed protein product [Colias eurytheme]